MWMLITLILVILKVSRWYLDYLDKNLFEPKFLGTRFFGTQMFFGPKFFGPKFFWDTDIFGTKFFSKPKLFWDPNISRPNKQKGLK